ncbi:DUF2690 domain-containing protein [Streptacidiphilus sp. EB129]|uniref:DUF2690 domain-containing protein n=1 Tax=Streptacidiphilus sp. EB129 TaxID=3156262 RepID=UPI0035191401
MKTISRTASKAAAVSVAALCLTFGLTANADAATYDGQDAISSGCASSAITAASTNIAMNDGTVVGQIQLRYSTGCRTTWARLLSYRQPTGTAQVYRNSDYTLYQCGSSLSWVGSLGAYSCYTPMVNDAGVTSVAIGSAYYDASTSTGGFATAAY